MLLASVASAQAPPTDEELLLFRLGGFENSYTVEHYARLKDISWMELWRYQWIGFNREQALYFHEFWPKSVPLDKLERLQALAKKNGIGISWPPHVVRYADVSLALLRDHLDHGVEFDAALTFAGAKISYAMIEPYAVRPTIGKLTWIHKTEPILEAVRLKFDPIDFGLFSPQLIRLYYFKSILGAGVPSSFANAYAQARGMPDLKAVGDPYEDSMISLYQQQIPSWDLQAIFSKRSETACDLYGAARTALLRFTEVTFNKEPVALPVPKEILPALQAPFAWTSRLDHRDYSQLFLELDRLIDVKTLHALSLPGVLRHLNQILAAKITYLDHIDDKVLHPEFNGCSLKKYWDLGQGDCDKYAALLQVLFSYAKQKLPIKLKNIYLVSATHTPAIRGKWIPHEWNLLVKLEPHRLTFSMLDPTFADNMAPESLDAMDDTHIDRKVFLEKLYPACQ